MIASISWILEQIEPLVKWLGPFKEIVLVIAAMIVAGAIVLTLLSGRLRISPPFAPPAQAAIEWLTVIVSAICVASIYLAQRDIEPAPDFLTIGILLTAFGILAAALYGFLYMWLVCFSVGAARNVITGAWLLSDAKKVLNGQVDGHDDRERNIPDRVKPSNRCDYFNKSGGDLDFLWSRNSQYAGRALLSLVYIIMALCFVASVGTIAAELTHDDVKKEETKGVKIVTFGADVLFGFDSSEIALPAKRRLDELANEIQNWKPKSIKVIGHTDMIGSEEYNQELSLRRANSVSNYLRQSGRFSEVFFSTFGYGETQPIYDETKFSGAQKNEAQQANRRVELYIDIDG